MTAKSYLDMDVVVEARKEQIERNKAIRAGKKLAKEAAKRARQELKNKRN